MADRDDVKDLVALERELGSVRAVEQVMRAVWALARAQQPLVEAAAAEADAWLRVAESIVSRLAGEPVCAAILAWWAISAAWRLSSASLSSVVFMNSTAHL